MFNSLINFPDLIPRLKMTKYPKKFSFLIIVDYWNYLMTLKKSIINVRKFGIFRRFQQFWSMSNKKVILL